MRTLYGFAFFCFLSTIVIVGVALHVVGQRIRRGRNTAVS
jgi:hypothetical protein